jgi:hypothetical protein
MSKRDFLKYLNKARINGYDFVMKNREGILCIVNYEEIKNILDGHKCKIRDCDTEDFDYILEVQIEEEVEEFEIGLM